MNGVISHISLAVPVGIVSPVITPEIPPPVIIHGLSHAFYCHLFAVIYKTIAVQAVAAGCWKHCNAGIVVSQNIIFKISSHAIEKKGNPIVGYEIFPYIG